MKDNRFSTFTQFFIWLLLFLSFSMLLNAIGSYAPSLEEGIPQWVAILWIVLPLCFIFSLGGILFQRRWGGYGLIATIALLIPTSVAINYYALLPNQPEELTIGWFVTSSFFFSCFGVILALLVFLAIRAQWAAFR